MTENTPPATEQHKNLNTLSQGEGEQNQIKAYSSVQKYR